MTRPFLALTMITIGLPDFPQTVCNRDEVAAVSVIPAKGERQRRIVHLCIWNLESGIWHLASGATGTSGKGDEGRRESRNRPVLRSAPGRSRIGSG
jgi:hypothetical protein